MARSAISAPASAAASTIRSTSSRERTLCASVIPPKPLAPSSGTPASAATLARLHSTNASPPAWKKTVSSTSWPCHPSCS